jgi:hypothetical protein
MVPRTRLLGIIEGPLPRFAPSQLVKRSRFDLPNALNAHAEGVGNLFQSMCAFVCDAERAFSRRFESVFRMASMLEVVSALRVPATALAARVHARTNFGEACLGNRPRNSRNFRRITCGLS